METSPAIVFTYNRLSQTKLTLEALNKNALANQTKLFIFNDAYNTKKEADEKKVNEVREYLTSFQHNNSFKNVQLIFQKSHKGLANSVIDGVNEIIKHYGSVIVTEDDLVSHQNYLNYMNDALAYYKDNPKIWSISGYGYPLSSLSSKEDVYFTYRGSSWGWATWENRWNSVDWNMKDYQLLMNPVRYYRLQKAGKDLYFMARDQKKHRIDSWAVRWVFEQSRHSQLTVYPATSFLHNIGLDGSGTHHSSSGNDCFSELSSVPYKLVGINVQNEILKEFNSHYPSRTLKGILTHHKWF